MTNLTYISSIFSFNKKILIYRDQYHRLSNKLLFNFLLFDKLEVQRISNIIYLY